MFKLSYQELRDQNFLAAMGKIVGCSEYKDIKVSYNIGRMKTVIDQKLKKSQEEWLELANPAVEKDERGNFKVDREKGTLLFKEGIDAEEMQKKIEEFTKREVIIERFKLKLDDLAPAKLSPADLSVLEPMIQTLEAVP